MDPLLKEFAQAIVDKQEDNEWQCCQFCDERQYHVRTNAAGEELPLEEWHWECDHLPGCVVLKAELLLATELLLENKNV